MFFKYGVKSVSIDDICNEMHISKKTFYTQFKQKSDLVVELLARMREQKRREQKEMLECDNIIEFLLKNFKKVTQPGMLEKHTALFYDLEKYYPDIFREHKKKDGEHSEEQARLVLLRGIEQGWFRKDIDVDMMAYFISRGFIVMSSMIPKSRSAKQRSAFFMDSFMRIVTSPEGLEYYLSYNDSDDGEQKC